MHSRVNERNGVTLSWTALKGQFGQEYADTKNFKRKFMGALQKAMSAYKEARIETVAGGLKLLPSSPPVPRSTVLLSCEPSVKRGQPIAAPQAGLSAPSPTPVIVQNLVSEEALQQVSLIARGWDKHALRADYEAWVIKKGEMPRNPDAAFLGWVKKYTKDKRP